jgi:hypothetical protein
MSPKIQEVVEMLDFSPNPALSGQLSEYEDDDEQPPEVVKNMLQQAPASFEPPVSARSVTTPYVPKPAPDFMSNRLVGHAPTTSTPACWPETGAIPQKRYSFFPTQYQDYNSDDETSHYQLPSRRLSRVRVIITSLPKHLTFNGKGNWSAFRLKFTQYAQACEWTDNECLNGLVWCLRNKALDYYTVISECSETFSYRSLLRRLEERFASSSSSLISTSYPELWGVLRRVGGPCVNLGLACVSGCSG